MSRVSAQAPSPLDQILGIARFARTPDARLLAGDVRYDLSRVGDVVPWTTAIQLARDLGAIGGAEAYALLDIVTEHAVGLETDTDATLAALTGQMRAIATANGLGEDEDYFLYEAPVDWLALNRRWDERFDCLRVELFRRIGEPGMANALQLFPDAFETRSREGRVALFEVLDDIESSRPVEGAAGFSPVIDIANAMPQLRLL